MIKGIFGIIVKALKVGLMIIPKLLMAIPVFGWILAAIVGLVALAMAFKNLLLAQDSELVANANTS